MSSTCRLLHGAIGLFAAVLTSAALAVEMRATRSTTPDDVADPEHPVSVRRSETIEGSPQQVAQQVVANAPRSAVAEAPNEHFEGPPGLNTRVCAPDGVALGGYDVVSYHRSATPALGRADLTAKHGALLYRFASADNRAAFIAAPQRYLPSYRGWCSTNLSMGRLACPDYTNYKIEGGKLLLFERVGFTNGRDVWNSDPSLHRRQADDNWFRFSKAP
ncbi:MAG: YHS domain-containing (seleno)protein [Pseudomonadota bacterium]